jgi:hypothetical protein
MEQPIEPFLDQLASGIQNAGRLVDDRDCYLERRSLPIAWSRM